MWGRGAHLSVVLLAVQREPLLVLFGSRLVGRSSLGDRLLGGSFLGLGYLWSLIDHEGRTLQDHRSGTRLIRVTRHR